MLSASILDACQTYFFANKKTAYNHLLSRKLSQETLDQYGVGFCTNGFGLHKNLCRSNNFDDDSFSKTGIFRNGSKGLFTPLHGKITIPIRDISGKIVSFGARATHKDEIPKYINGAESEIYIKQENLFGLDLALDRAIQDEAIILVEGYFDVMALHQCKISNVASVSSAHLSYAQALLLRTLGIKKALLYLDNDKAGERGAYKSAEILKKFAIECRIIRPSKYKDASEWLSNAQASWITDRMNDILY